MGKLESTNENWQDSDESWLREVQERLQLGNTEPEWWLDPLKMELWTQRLMKKIEHQQPESSSMQGSQSSATNEH